MSTTRCVQKVTRLTLSKRLCRLTKNVHRPFQNCSLEKVYTGEGGTPIPGNSAGILLSKLLSVRRLQSLGRRPRFLKTMVLRDGF